MVEVFFDDTQSLLKVGICSIIGFVVLFLFIRISGKRTLSQLNAFDFVVSVSMGSTLANIILAKSTIAEGSLALAILILLQFLLAWLTTKSKKMEKAINSQPTLLFYNGDYLKTSMQKEFVTKDEILAEARKMGFESLDQTRAVILELDGKITIVQKSANPEMSSLESIPTGKYE